jgi:DNA-binding CsgD family transcriptional regulator
MLPATLQPEGPAARQRPTRPHESVATRAGPSISYRWKNATGAAAFGVIGVLAAIDAIGDVQEGVPVWNVTLDLTLTAGALLAGIYFLWRFLRVSRQTSELLHALGQARADAEQWRLQCAAVFPEIGAAILRQFDRWSLTPEEQEIALAVLRGLTTEEIAERQGAAPIVIRRQTNEIYRKAGVDGPTGLSAYFLSDLLFVAGQGFERRQDRRDH